MIRTLHALAVLLWLCSAAVAQNFTGDPDMVDAANKQRVLSSMFWSGEPIPAWSAPCPITYTATGEASGATTFRFANGEVVGWKMTVRGDRREAIRNVVPHEVDHAVRASLVRKPVVRWLDEGCATIWEEPEHQERVRRIAKTCTLPDFHAKDYPIDPQQCAALYAVGFVAVEILLHEGGPYKVLAVSRHENIEDGLRSEFGYGLDGLARKCREWQQSGEVTAECPPYLRARNTLVVWHAPWCAQCKVFVRDFNDDGEFRRKVISQYAICYINADWRPVCARIKKVRALPTFDGPGFRIEGYQGKEKFLAALFRSGDDAPLPPVEAPPSQGSGDPPPASAAPPPPPEPVVPPATKPKPKTHQETVDEVAGESSEGSNEKPPAEPQGAAVTENPPATEATETAPPIQEAPPPPPEPPFELPAKTPPVAQTALPESQTESSPTLADTEHSGGLLGAVPGLVATLLPLAIGAGGGGAGTAAVLAARALLRLRQRRKSAGNLEAGTPKDAPFPRQLDEARQLLRLREQEGRVVVLDALRGMLFEDEIRNRVEAASSESEKQMLLNIGSAIDARVGEIAPLSVKVEP